MEERYWQVLKALDRDSYVALWDEDFVGWPYPLLAPIYHGPRCEESLSAHLIARRPKSCYILRFFDLMKRTFSGLVGSAYRGIALLHH